MSPRITLVDEDLVGKRFNKWTILTFERRVGKRTYYKAQCDCGNIRVSRGDHFKGGHSTSCGCLNIKDLTGKRFGHLIVIRLERYSHNSGRKDAYAHWRCKCDCGNETIRSYARLGRLYDNTHISCGCMAKKQYRHSDMLNYVYRMYKRNAYKRKYAWLISEEETDTLIKSACFYCGTPPNNTYYYAKEFKYSGIDRIDNTQGYSIDNVIPCCGPCNRMKMDYTQEFFLSHIKQIIRHLEE